MIVNINNVVPNAGWKKRIESNNLVIEKDVEFDIFTFMDTPMLRFPIQIHPITQVLEIDLNDYKAYDTDATSVEVLTVVEQK